MVSWFPARRIGGYQRAGMCDELADVADDAMNNAATEAPKGKRTKLRRCDQMPVQVLNANGESGIGKTPLPQLAIAMASGNKIVSFFSELCDPAPKQKGVGISRHAEVQLAVGAKLQEPIYKTHIEKSVYKAAMQEFADLEPSFKMLMGKGISMEDNDTTDTVGRIAYGNGGTMRHRDKEDVDKAAAKVYAWLKQPTSKLRALTAFLSGGGLFYVASVHEKCHRAYIGYGHMEGATHKEVSETNYAAWASARLCTATSTAASSDLDGL